MNEAPAGGKRRIDRILQEGYVEGLSRLPLDELRGRRDECLAEREYLSLIRRMVQGRADILRAERDRRRGTAGEGTLVDRLPSILADEGPRGHVRGEAVRVAIAEEELAQARRRVERLVADAVLSNPAALSDDDLDGALDRLLAEEREVSGARGAVIAVHDLLQEELKRRYKEDPSRVPSA